MAGRSKAAKKLVAATSFEDPELGSVTSGQEFEVHGEQAERVQALVDSGMLREVDAKDNGPAAGQAANEQ